MRRRQEGWEIRDGDGGLGQAKDSRREMIREDVRGRGVRERMGDKAVA